MSETNIPDEARAAFLAAFSDEDGRWHPAWWERALAAAAPHIRAAERQRLHDLEARVEALADAIQVEQIITTMDASSDDRAYVRGFNSGLHKATWVVSQALVSPVSDDTPITSAPGYPGADIPPGQVTERAGEDRPRRGSRGVTDDPGAEAPVSDDTGGTKP